MEQIKLTVRQLNMYVKSLFEGDVNLSSLILVGELSNFKNHFSSGHLYFVLKDKDASIRSVMFRGNASKINFIPKDGMQVVCRGYVSLFERDGQYQFYAETMSLVGDGDIALEFERIKSKLEAEGLFDIKRKRAINPFPKKIGVITSNTGAALQDILNISSRRFPLCEIVIFPALVQSISAPQSLINALDRAYKRNDISTIIIGRGGGSAEDLSCFNDETLARKVASSPVPIISAVGHETDFSICDFVADLRAPTPSSAAELAMPSSDDINNTISLLKQKIKTDAYSIVCDRNTKVQMLMNHRCFSSPVRLFTPFELRLDKAVGELHSAYNIYLQKHFLRLSSAESALYALSPQKTLDRGFSVTLKDNVIIKSVDNINDGDNINIQLSDGFLKCTVNSVEKE